MSIFNKCGRGGAGAFEEFLQEIGEPLGRKLENDALSHSERQCGVRHQCIAVDGHAKLHTERFPTPHKTAADHSVLRRVTLP